MNKVRYEYRCRRCKDVFMAGEYIEEREAIHALRRIAEDEDVFPSSVVHDCTDGGKGFADLVGLSPRYLAIDVKALTR